MVPVTVEDTADPVGESFEEFTPRCYQKYVK